DGLVSHVGNEMLALLRRPGLRDRRGVAVKHGVPLAGLALVEPIEVIEPLACGPMVEWAGRADLHLRRVVGFTEHSGGVAIVPENLGDHGGALRNVSCVTRKSGAEFDDHAGPHRMMVSAS